MKKLTPPEIILFDWHATLVGTSEALYHALDDVLPQSAAAARRARTLKLAHAAAVRLSTWLGRAQPG
jgi:hypothetical protein